MDKYAIHCTEAQTKKALELGAPITNIHTVGNDGITKEWKLVNPTAEEMIGWIEEQGYQFNLNTNMFNEWEVIVYAESTGERAYTTEKVVDSDWKDTKKEAIIAAIDAALEYLTNKKK